MKKATASDVQKIIGESNKIVIVQADNPDVDSLASALALEQILGDLGKDPLLYCGVDLPSYMSYLPGSDRVTTQLPKQFDLGIIVDTSSDTLLEQLRLRGQRGWLAAKPCLIIDHHATAPTIDFAELSYIDTAVSTGELIYRLAKELDWPLSLQAKDFIAMSILSDSLGLTSEATTAEAIRVIADLVEGGVKMAELENARRASMRREPELIHFKGRLLQRVQFHDNDRITTLEIPWEEIEKYSPLYNPSMLVIDDMRLGKDTAMAICFKIYRGSKITAKIRCNYGKGVADKLAEHFGGGGHAYAAGFKITDGRSFELVKSECLSVAAKLLDGLEVI